MWEGRSSWFVFVYLREIHPSGAVYSPYSTNKGVQALTSMDKAE